jgi:uncharacterized protein (TIGR03083 family)
MLHLIEANICSLYGHIATHLMIATCASVRTGSGKDDLVTELAIWRETATTNLDGFIDRLQSLSTQQWQAQTPDEGWEVRHLAAHLVGTVGYMTGMLNKIVTPAEDPAAPQPADVTPESSTSDIIANLQIARHRHVDALAKLTETDLAKLADNPNPYFTPNGDLYLTMAVFESGIHRYDLEFALDPANATLDPVTIQAIDSMYGGNLPTMAGMSEITPDTPLGYRFSGSEVQHDLAWNGEKWIAEPLANVPVATIQGSDAALALFMTGRIPADDPQLQIDGDRTIAGQFKSFVPGP